jgi:chromosomal replication initiation ATPase DnaA
MYLAMESGISTSRIGFFFRRDHSTVVYAHARIGRRLAVDPSTREMVDLVCSYLR